MATWFASGAVLIYVPFPSLSVTDRIQRQSDVDTSVLALTPANAILASRTSQTIDRIRLIARGNRPLYVIKGRGASVVAVWADNGKTAAVDEQAVAREIATKFIGAKVKRIDGPVDFDQWVVHQGFDAERPFWRVHFDDVTGTVLYVSQRSGEVLQRTNRTERRWNYVGAVAHWIYPTVLRKHWSAWDQVVWWLSLAGIFVVMVGIWLGIDRMVAALRANRRKISLFRGWMRWHHILGLCAFAFVLTWIFSGWLSMDHGRIFAIPDPTPQQVDRFRGMPLAEASKQVSVDFIRNLGSFRQLEIKSIGAVPFAIVQTQNDRSIYSLVSGEVFRESALPQNLILAAVKRTWPGVTVQSAEDLGVNDVYRKVRQSELPISTVRVKLNDPGNTWVHVDAASGEIVSVMNRGRRLYRWLYHGLHSLDFPGLINRRPLWDIVILSLLALGFAFSITGAYLGVTRLKKLIAKKHSWPIAIT